MFPHTLQHCKAPIFYKGQLYSTKLLSGGCPDFCSSCGRPHWDAQTGEVSTDSTFDRFGHQLSCLLSLGSLCQGDCQTGTQADLED